MAMRVGEMMVIIRAQDFASRTLRRVGGEFSHLSRDQQMAFRKSQLAWQKYDAQASRFAANEMQRQLNLAKTFRTTSDQLQQALVRKQRIEERLARVQSRIQSFPQPRTATGQFATQSPAQLAQLRQMHRLQDQLQRSLTHTERVTDGLTGAQSKLNRAISQYPTWVRRAANSTVAYADGISRVSREYQTAYRNLATWQQNQLAFDQALRRMPINRIQEASHALGGIARTMQLFGAASTVALGASANAAANFNTEISLAATQARDLAAPASQVNERIEQLTNGFKTSRGEMKGVLDLMNEFPATQNEMAAASFDIFSSMNLMTEGITDVGEGLDLLATANKIAVAGGEDLATATNAMITVFNNFDPQLKNTSATLDTMFDIIRFGRMRLGDFNTMMNKIAPAAAGAGLSLRDVGGAMAFLTEVMPSQRMVATGISRLIEALNHPDIVKGLRILGVNVRKASGEMRPLDQIMQDLAERFPKLAAGQQTAAEFFKMVSRTGRGGGQGVMFTAEGRKALTQILTHMGQYIERQRQVDQNTGEFAKAHQAQMESLGVQWDIFMNRIRAVVIAIGTDAIPVFQELGEVVSRLLRWWQSLNPETRQFVVRMAVMASVATLVGGAILAIVAAFGGMAAMFARFFLNAQGVSGILGKIGRSLGVIAGLAALSIIINVKRKGDASAWDFLMGILTGAAAGFAVGGPLGALVGGITVPIIIQIMEDSDLAQDIADRMREASRQQHPAARRYGEYLAGQVEAGAKTAMSRDEFDQFTKTFDVRDKLEGNRVRLHNQATKEAAKNARTTKTNTDAQTNYNKAMDVYLKKMDKYNTKSKEYRNELENHKRAVKEYNQNLVRETVRAQEEAVDNLRKLYMDLEQINQNLMGELFQGPLLGGESFDLAKEWGVTANIDSMIKDLRMANAQFMKIQRGLDTLRKKGIPRGIIDEIQSMEPQDALAYIQSILKGTPKQQAALIAAFKQRNKNVQEQTKMDFVDEIERFRRAGVSMGDALKSGFQQAQVGAWFDNWVKVQFPGVINSAVNQAVSDWRKTNPMPTAPTAPRRPVRPTVPLRGNLLGGLGLMPGVGSAGGVTVNDHSQTNVNIRMGDSPATAMEKREEERRIGFIARQAVQGRGRVVGRPWGLGRTHWNHRGR